MTLILENYDDHLQTKCDHAIHYFGVALDQNLRFKPLFSSLHYPQYLGVCGLV